MPWNHDQAEKEAAAYMTENRGRWYGLLQRAWYQAELFDLDRPPRELMFDDEMETNPEALVNRFFWRTTHKGRMVPDRCKNADALLEMGATGDAGLAWSNFIGMERSFPGCLSTNPLRYALQTSGERIVWGHRVWKEQSEDYRAMIRCLSGDLASDALRYLVLGEDR